MKILCIYGSPRAGGTTDTLLDEFVKGASDSGAEVIKKYLRDMAIVPCTECGGCDEDGRCIYDDDYQDVFDMLHEVDAMIVSSPIFFYGLPAIVKAFVDRSQQFYIRKYVLHAFKDVRDEDKKPGFFLSAGATTGKRIFDGPLLNMKYFYDAINFKFEDSFLHKGLENNEALNERPEILKECYDAGVNVAKKLKG